MTVRSLEAAQSALWWSWPVLSALSLSTSFSGLAMYYLYADCDPLLAGRIDSRDQLLPLFVIDVLGRWPGIPGLFVSGIFAASLSTVSALVNSLAAVTLEDYLKPLWWWWLKRPLNESGSALPSKLLALVYGFVCIGVAFAVQYLGSLLQASLTVFGVVGGPLFGLFTLGMMVPSVRQRVSVIWMEAAGFNIELTLCCCSGRHYRPAVRPRVVRDHRLWPAEAGAAAAADVAGRLHRIWRCGQRNAVAHCGRTGSGDTVSVFCVRVKPSILLTFD